MKSVLIYFTGGANYSVPTELSMTYILIQLRFILFSYIVTYYFEAQYTAITMVLAAILADLRFFLDFSTYIESLNADNGDEEEDS